MAHVNCDINVAVYTDASDMQNINLLLLFSFKYFFSALGEGGCISLSLLNITLFILYAVLLEPVLHIF